jgi:hypothetical protein
MGDGICLDSQGTIRAQTLVVVRIVDEGTHKSRWIRRRYVVVIDGYLSTVFKDPAMCHVPFDYNYDSPCRLYLGIVVNQSRVRVGAQLA